MVVGNRNCTETGLGELLDCEAEAQGMQAKQGREALVEQGTSPVSNSAVFTGDNSIVLVDSRTNSTVAGDLNIELAISNR